jgi:transcription-repair coupling factor (superfamily II helicase)
MSLNQLVKEISKNPVWQDLTKAISTETTFKIAAPNTIFSFITNHLVNNSDSIILAVTSNTKEADRLVHELSLWNKEISVANFPSWETLPHEKIEPTKDIVGQRLAVIRRLSHPDNNYFPARKLDVVVAPIRSLMQPILKDLQDLEPLALKPGDSIDLTKAITQLVDLGYERVEIVEKRGEFAVRG